MLSFPSWKRWEWMKSKFSGSWRFSVTDNKGLKALSLLCSAASRHFLRLFFPFPWPVAKGSRTRTKSPWLHTKWCLTHSIPKTCWIFPILPSTPMKQHPSISFLPPSTGVRDNLGPGLVFSHFYNLLLMMFILYNKIPYPMYIKTLKCQTPHINWGTYSGVDREA